VLPDRNAERVRRLSPFHRLDDVGTGLLDETPDPPERLAAPVTEFFDASVDQPGGGGGDFFAFFGAVFIVAVVAFFIAFVTSPSMVSLCRGFIAQ
jgi:hypothetical protein